MAIQHRPIQKIACIQKPRKLFLAKTRPSLGVDWVPLPTRQQPTHQLGGRVQSKKLRVIQ